MAEARRSGSLNPIWARLLMAFSLALSGCGEDPSRLAGGASETEATLAGRVLNPDGTPAADVPVRLRPAHFLRDTALAVLPKDAAPGHPDAAPGHPRAFPDPGRVSADSRTDASGNFHFDSVYLGDYSIEALGGDARGVHLRASVTGAGRRFRTDDGILQPVSEIRGRITLPKGTEGGAYVQVYGLDRAARADSTGAFSLAGMPAGVFSLRISPVSSAASARSLYSVILLPQSIRDLGEVPLAPELDAEDYSLWLDSARVRVNTAAAGLSQGLRGFPILLRLDRSNFDFTTSTGLDLRFASAAGRHLAYEAEHWDPLEGRASIWVRTDTLLAGDSAQFVTMYWNRPGAAGRSDGSAVFDTADGYHGVWHLGRDPSDPDFTFHDASGRGNHAQGEGLSGAGQAAGAVHLAQDLNGQTQSIRTSKPFAGPDIFTLSLWFRTTTAAGGKLAGFGSHQDGPSNLFDRHIWMDNQGRIHFGVYPGPEAAVEPGIRRILSTSHPLNDGAWHHVVGRLSRDGQFLFIDGNPVAADPSTQRASHYTGFWRFGYDNLGSWESHPSSLRFQGVLDEMRVSSRARPDAWLKLSYENQKPGSTVVSLLP